MNTFRKFGGFAALDLATAYLTGMVIFIAVLDYPSITNLAQVDTAGQPGRAADRCASEKTEYPGPVRPGAYLLGRLDGDRAAAQQSG